MIARIAQAIREKVARTSAPWRTALRGRWLKARHAEEPDAHRAGRWGEQVAERFLRRQGYKILGRRVRLSNRDELDLVARKADVLVFVEVKTRRSEEYGRPLAAVHPAKRRLMTRAALRYLRRLKHKPPYLRFDIVEVVGTPTGGEPVVRHIESCFTLERPHCIPW